MAGILPPVTGADIGATGEEWTDAYIAGQMIDADENAVSVADIAGHIDAISGAHPATAITVDTTNFDNNLSAADDTVQKALETLDELTASGATPEAIRRSGYFTDNPANYSQGTNILDFVKFVQCTDAGDGKRKSTSGRYKKVYVNTISWDPTYTTGGASGRVSFKLKVEKFDESGYDTTSTFYAVAYGDSANITSSNKDTTNCFVTFSITFDATLMVQGQTYTGSETISQIHPDIFRLYNRTLTGDLIARHRNTDPFPAAAHAIRLSPSVIRNATLDIRTVGADTCWRHTNGDFRRFLFKRLYAYDASNWGLEVWREGDTRNTYALLFTATGANSQTATATVVTKTSTGAGDGDYTFTATIDTSAGVWSLDTFDDTGMSPSFVQSAYNKYASACAASCWREVYAVSRTDSNTLAKMGLESILPVGTHVRMYSGAARPTTLTDWKHGYVVAVGTNAVDICGEEVPTGGASLFVEYSTNAAMTMRIEKVMVPGLWAYATGTGRLASQTFAAMPFDWPEKEARLIGAIGVRSLSDDSGATQPTMMFTAGGTDLLAGALSVSETAVTTGVVASGQAVSFGEAIDIDCESTGTKADSKDLQAWILVARHV